jgi:hypothetical protein
MTSLANTRVIECGNLWFRCRHVRTLVIQLSLLGVLLMPSTARAECIVLEGATPAQPRVELVFSGNVVGINQVAPVGVRITFNVEDNWAFARRCRSDGT